MHRLDLSKGNVLVVGDIILDLYYSGKVSRISPEAPVPVVKVTDERPALGGSGNVINNIAHLGTGSHLIAVTGRDDNKKILLDLLNSINAGYSLIETGLPTTTKIRVIGEHQQIVRLDFETADAINKKTENKIIKSFDAKIDKADVVIISDYGKGVCTPDLCAYIIGKCRLNRKPVIVDPKGYDWTKYKNAALITPNLKELGEVCGKNIANEDDEIEKHGKNIIRKYKLDHLLVTRSDKGMSLISKRETYHIPTAAIEVYDVSGAGDTAVAAVASSLSAGYNMIESVQIANKAAGIVVSKFGTAPVEFEELIHALVVQGKSKIISRELFERIARYLVRDEHKVIFATGKYDILNPKHLAFLKNARLNCDKLVIGTDDIQKGENPVLEIMANLEFLDYIVIIKKEERESFLKRIPKEIKIISR